MNKILIAACAVLLLSVTGALIWGLGKNSECARLNEELNRRDAALADVTAKLKVVESQVTDFPKLERALAEEKQRRAKIIKASNDGFQSSAEIFIALNRAVNQRDDLINKSTNAMVGYFEDLAENRSLAEKHNMSESLKVIEYLSKLYASRVDGLPDALDELKKEKAERNEKIKKLKIELEAQVREMSR